MPTKLQNDTNYWRAREARLKTRAVLPSENPADYALLVAEYHARFNPTLPGATAGRRSAWEGAHSQRMAIRGSMGAERRRAGGLRG
jgi:hypothetical protein